MLDYLIKNARICDGNLTPTEAQHVGIQGDRIQLFQEEKDCPEAKQTIDADGFILTPGFIDPHASTGFGYFFPNAADHKLYQGITTEIFGNCGTSPAPIGKHLLPTMERLSEEIGFPFQWRSLTEYFNKIEDKLQFNIGTLVGHSTLRGGYMEDWKVLTTDQLEDMKAALSQAMEEGALGLSTGLIYAPGCFAEAEEIIALTKIVAAKGGIYASHIRNERDKLEDAITEALDIAEKSEIPVLISHLKAAEKENWGKIPNVLAQIEAYNKQHDLKATVDVYPYTAVSTKLRAFIPKYILQDGISAVAEKVKDPKVVADIADWIVKKDYDLSQMMIISDEFEDYYSKNVSDIAEALQLSLAETIAKVLQDDTDTWVVYHCINQDDIDTAINWPNAMICTDSWSYPINAPKSIGQPHPRSYGAFTAYLERYVLQEGHLDWDKAIHKITDLPARLFNLKNRGRIENNYFADLVLINPATLKANATYLKPKSLSSGVEYLWVNGQLVIKNGEMQAVCPGKVLKPNKD
ncbi:MAG: amidohydrolase family protein [Saprospiraceae bacterium]